MKNNWQTKKLAEILDKVVYTNKILSKRYLENGKFPIISQEEKMINGYWDNEEDVFKIKHPVVIFGDHTKILKYVDFNFVLGADGVKILQPRQYIYPRYLYYFLKSIQIMNLGYARHYKLIKNSLIAFPESINEQKRIVKKLDEVFEKIDKAKENTEKNLKNSHDLFESYLDGIFIKLSEQHGVRKFPEVCLLQRGSSPRPIKKYLTESKDGVNWIKIGDTQGIEKYLSKIKEKITKKGAEHSRYVKDGDLILSNSMSFGKPFILKTKGYIHDGWFVLRPKQEIISEYLYYLLSSPFLQKQFNDLASGAIVKNISSDLVNKSLLVIPPISEQRQILKKLDVLSDLTRKLEENYRKKLADLDELKKSVLQKAFAGEL